MFIKYDCLSRLGLPNTKTIIEFKCDKCDKFAKRNMKTHNKILENSLSSNLDLCRKCWQRLLNNRPEYKEKMKSRLSEVASNPEWRRRNSESKKGKINIGLKNGSKRNDVRQKMSASRIKLLSDPCYRERIRQYTKKAWEDGKFDNVKVGKCKWFEHIKPDGTSCKLQGTWEVMYAKWMDENHITYEVHKDRISYIDENGIQRSYYPDFKLCDQHYVEVKSSYILKLQHPKFDLVREQNKHIKIDLVTKETLIELGIMK